MHKHNMHKNICSTEITRIANHHHAWFVVDESVMHPILSFQQNFLILLL
jgi:hypothetical protein